MDPYNSRGAAIGFAIFGLLMWAFMAFGPFREAPWWGRFVLWPLFIFWLWATPPRTPNK